MLPHARDALKAGRSESPETGYTPDPLLSAWNTVMLALAPLSQAFHTAGSHDATRPRIPVTVLSGFLGAGKTTLLCRLLEEAEEEIIAIVNDLASVNIDAMRVRGSVATTAQSETIQLENGCACCVLGNDLDAMLTEIGTRARRPARIILEASGISDPVGLAQTIANNLSTVLDGIVTLVDAQDLHRALADANRHRLLHRQLEAAHLIALSKTSGCEAPARARADVARLAPGRPVLVLDDLPSPVSDLLLGASCKGARPSPPLREHDYSGFSSRVFASSSPVDGDALFRLLDGIPDSVYRIKGWLTLRKGEHGQRQEIQSAGTRWRTTVAGADSNEDQLVVIGRAGAASLAAFCAALHQLVPERWMPTDPSPDTAGLRPPAA